MALTIRPVQGPGRTRQTTELGKGFYVLHHADCDLLFAAALRDSEALTCQFAVLGPGAYSLDPLIFGQ